MPDVTTVAAVVGAITGPIALWVAIKNYLRVTAMKALDLRLEIGKAFNNLDVVLSGISGYLDYVRKSHLAVLSAIGLNQSGAMKAFEEDFAKDKVRLEELLRSQPKRESDYERRSPEDIERLIVTVHAYHGRVADIRKKYEKVFDSDEERRKEIRAAHQPRV